MPSPTSPPTASPTPTPTSSPAGDVHPPPCADASLFYDTPNQRMLLVTCVDQANGQTWEQFWAWDGSNWSLIDEGGRPLVVTGVAWDTDRQVMTRYGGLPLESNECDQTTWDWDGAGGWQQADIIDVPNPEACDHVKLAYDAARQETLLFGGGRRENLSSFTERWDGAAWGTVADSGPPPRAHHELIYDAAHEQTLLYGGYDGTQVFDDLWSWNGSDWEEIELQTSPGPRSHAAVAMHGDALLLFGGATGTSTFGTLIDETWLLTDGAWSKLEVEGPGARGSPAMGYDPDGSVSVLYGGFGSDGGELDDTWEFDGTTWSCVDGC